MTPILPITAVGSFFGLLVYAAIGGDDWLVVAPLTIASAFIGVLVAERIAR